MVRLNNKQIINYLHRSFTAVDGLWFLKVEDKYTFDEALKIDQEVWKVMPKIQARMLKSFGNLEGGIEALCDCLTTKLVLDGFKFKTVSFGSGFKIIIEECPWHNILVQSKRASLSGSIGKLICSTEYSVWASEFNDDIHFELKEHICEGSESCILQFTH